jgi:hypothetical protein
MRSPSALCEQQEVNSVRRALAQQSQVQNYVLATQWLCCAGLHPPQTTQFMLQGTSSFIVEFHFCFFAVSYEFQPSAFGIGLFQVPWCLL